MRGCAALTLPLPPSRRADRPDPARRAFGEPAAHARRFDGDAGGSLHSGFSGRFCVKAICSCSTTRGSSRPGWWASSLRAGEWKSFLERAVGRAGSARAAPCEQGDSRRAGDRDGRRPVRVVSKEGDLWKVALPAPTLEFFEKWGEVPLPPYIHRAPDAADRQRYQSIFARYAGAVAAPTASLHFDDELMRVIEARGVQRAFVTLHVGAGTFQPVRTDDLESHVMHAEWVSVDAATCQAITRTRAAGGRVVSIGTTVARALWSPPHSPRPRGANWALIRATLVSSSPQASSSASSTHCSQTSIYPNQPC